MERGKYCKKKKEKNKIGMGLLTLDYHFISHRRKSFYIVIKQRFDFIQKIFIKNEEKHSVSRKKDA